MYKGIYVYIIYVYNPGFFEEEPLIEPPMIFMNTYDYTNGILDFLFPKPKPKGIEVVILPKGEGEEPPSVLLTNGWLDFLFPKPKPEPEPSGIEVALLPKGEKGYLTSSILSNKKSSSFKSTGHDYVVIPKGEKGGGSSGGFANKLSDLFKPKGSDVVIVPKKGGGGVSSSGYANAVKRIGIRPKSPASTPSSVRSLDYIPYRNKVSSKSVLPKSIDDAPPSRGVKNRIPGVVPAIPGSLPLTGIIASVPKPKGYEFDVVPMGQFVRKNSVKVIPISQKYHFGSDLFPKIHVHILPESIGGTPLSSKFVNRGPSHMIIRGPEGRPPSGPLAAWFPENGIFDFLKKKPKQTTDDSTLMVWNPPSPGTIQKPVTLVNKQPAK